MKIKPDVLYRSAEISHIDVDKRTVDLSFSSEETIVERYFGRERLVHDIKSVRLGRINAGGALLLDHDTKQQIGKVERAWIDPETKKGMAKVRFSKAVRASEVFDDVVDGIRTNISAGYTIHEAEVREIKGGDKVVHATDWEPMEISFVSIPADTTVGVGRAVDLEVIPERSLKLEVKKMEPEVVNNPVPNPLQVRRDLDAMILATGTDLGDVDMARDIIASNGTLDDLKTKFKEKRAAIQVENPVKPASHLDMTRKERKQFSFVRAIMNQVDPKNHPADFEVECSAEVAKRSGKSPRGFFVPYDIQNQPMNEYVEKRSDIDMLVRAIHEVATPSRGGFLVGTELLDASFIELLRAKMVITQLGATFLTGLVGNVLIPKQITSHTGEWVAEGVAAAQSNMTFAQVPLTPKTFTANGEYTRLLMLQSTPGIEALMRADLVAVMARGIDKGAISGAGGVAPTGILGAAGVNVVATNVSFEKEEAVAMMTAIANANADFDGQAFLTTPTIAGALMTRAELGNTLAIPLFVNGKVVGYPVYTSTQVPANTVIFGAWSQLLIGEWGSLDIMVNPHGVNARAGNVEIYAFQTIDVAVRYGEAFSKLTDFV